MTRIDEYARALFELAESEGRTDELMADVVALCAALSNEPRYVRLIDSPALAKEERLALIDAAFAPLDGYLRNLIKILAEKRSSALLLALEGAFRELYDEARGIERVLAETAVPMTEEQLAKMRARLEAETGKTVIIENRLVPSLLGGVRLRYAGRQLDGTVRARLDGLEKSLRTVIV